MAAKVEMHASSTVCRMCGTAYSTLNGFFYKCYAQPYKGTGYMSVCKHCVEKLYEDFLRESKSEEAACHQICRKFNIYWNKELFDAAMRGSPTRTLVVGYLNKVNVVKYQGMSYDDTMREFGMLWETPHKKEDEPAPPIEVIEDESDIEIAEEIKTAWGPGYSNKQYEELEQRRKYWVEDLASRGVDTNDIGVGALLRQIVATEIEINRGRANGEDVDKKVNTFNTLIGNAILKPSQKKSDVDISIDNTPLGMWVLKYENERPLPKDENESVLKKFVHTWMFGHLAKMVGLRNSYTQMYEDEMDRLRVSKPEYADEDDDTIITDAFGEDVFDNG